VGKSSIVVRFVDDTFTGLMAPTIGVEYKSKIFDVYGKRVKATIWDTAGAERYRTITSNYYRGSHAIIFVYDVTEKSSFDNIEKFWLKEVKEYFPDGNEIVMMLVGNKIDNVENRVITEQQGEELARKHNMLFIETSA
jgi:small GTP-binding protein